MADAPQQKIAALEKKVGTGAKSPLFARLAAYYVQQGKATEALQMCDAGLAAFPHFTTGHLIKGKALLALKMNAEARREFEIVQQFLPANETVAFIISNIRPGDGESLTPSSSEPATTQPSRGARPQAAAPEPAVIAEEPAPQPEPEMPSAPAMAEEMPPVEPQAETAPPANFFEAVAANPEAVEDPFGFGSGAGTATPPSAETVAPEEVANPFEGFPTQPEPQATETPSSGSIFDFPAQAAESPAGISEEETFEAYAGRMRNELSGENTLSLDEYLSGSPAVPQADQQEPPSTAEGSIEDLAEKLQTAKKITPVINLSTRTPMPVSEADTPASTGFVTPTLAEIYAKQGWYDDAIKAYRTLCINKPAEKERFEKRIEELEEMKKQQT